MKMVFVLGFGFALASSAIAQEQVWTPKAELSYVSTSGNTRTQTFSGKLELKGEMGADRFLLSLGYLNARDDGVDKASRLNADLRYEHVFAGRLFGFLGAGYLRDRFAGFEHRISAGPGLGLDILKEDLHTLKGSISSEYVHESSFPSDAGESEFATASLGVEYGWKIRENVTYSLDIRSMHSLKDSEKYYIEAKTSLSVAMNATISIGISYSVNYQNSPAAPDIERADTSFLTSLIVTP